MSFDSVMGKNIFDSVMYKPKKRKVVVQPWDRANKFPVLQCGAREKIAGFRDKRTGKFEEVMLVNSNNDLQFFMKTYQLADVKKEY